MCPSDSAIGATSALSSWASDNEEGCTEVTGNYWRNYWRKRREMEDIGTGVSELLVATDVKVC